MSIQKRGPIRLFVPATITHARQPAMENLAKILYDYFRYMPVEIGIDGGNRRDVKEVASNLAIPESVFYHNGSRTQRRLRKKVEIEIKAPKNSVVYSRKAGNMAFNVGVELYKMHDRQIRKSSFAYVDSDIISMNKNFLQGLFDAYSFSQDAQYVWADYDRIDKNRELKGRLTRHVVPAFLQALSNMFPYNQELAGFRDFIVDVEHIGEKDSEKLKRLKFICSGEGVMDYNLLGQVPWATGYKLEMGRLSWVHSKDISTVRPYLGLFDHDHQKLEKGQTRSGLGGMATEVAQEILKSARDYSGANIKEMDKGVFLDLFKMYQADNIENIWKPMAKYLEIEYDSQKEADIADSFLSSVEEALLTQDKDVIIPAWTPKRLNTYRKDLDMIAKEGIRTEESPDYFIPREPKLYMPPVFATA